MPVVLGKAAHPHNAMQCTGWLVACAAAKFRHAQRQISVGFQALIENLNMAGAVHRLERIDGLFAGMFFIHLNDEHILLVFVPMA